MTDQENQGRIDWLVSQALKLPEANRAAFLDKECSVELRPEVDSLLKAHKEVKSDFLRHPVLPGIPETDEASYASGSDPKKKETVTYQAVGTPMRPGSHDNLPQRIGRYEIVSVIGEGSFGIVYRAYDPELSRDVAIKVPRPEVVGIQIDIDAYLEEARTVASITHSSIVKVHDFGRTDDGSCYVVSEYVPGGNLRSAMDKGRYSPSEAAELVATLADALAHVHQRGIYHRDVKPENILLDESGHPMLTDFGLALRAEDFGDGSNWCGTVAYMSPEQAQGKASEITCQSDIYSLGVVLYELLTGKSPYRKRDKRISELLKEIAEGTKVRPLRELNQLIPHELEEVCLHALRQRPKFEKKEYTSAADFAADLRGAIPTSTPKRRIGLWALGGLAAVALTLVFVLWPTRQVPAESPLRVLGVDIQHLANLNDEFDRPLGFIGKDSFAARLDDSVNIRAKLSRPAYAYIIAFRPDGQDELCFPENESEIPPLTDRPRYPWARQDVNYGLNEGTGLWLFAVVASNEPLPAYGQWRSLQPSPPWQPAEAPKNVVLWDDGEWLERLTPVGATRGDRGKGVPAKNRVLVVQVTDWLKEATGAEAVAAIGFAVLPKD